MDSIIVKCNRCGGNNRVLVERINSNPSCGKCKAPLYIPDKQIEINFDDFRREVEDHKGFVLLYLWSPT